MSKDARDLDLSPTEQAKFDELIAMLARRGFGEQGPPRNTTFAEIERFGHQAGRMVARALDARLAAEHAEHFATEEPCPKCGEKHPPKKERHKLPVQTEDGAVELDEPAFRCPPCERDFFPSANSVAD